SVSPLDVEFLEDIAGENWEGDCAVYAHNSGSLSRLTNTGKLIVSLKTLECEIFTISPIRVFNQNLHFAPIGLLDMYNSGGAIEAINCTANTSGCVVKIEARGCGKLGAYSNFKPELCKVDTRESEFSYNHGNNMLTVHLPMDCSFRDIEIVY
ncbi:hypothetical protein CRG98_012988, partial [Punica granatum]